MSLAKQRCEESKVTRDSNIAAFKAQVTEARIRKLLQPYIQGGKFEAFMSLTDVAAQLLDAPSEGLAAERAVWLMEAIRMHGFDARLDDRATSSYRVQIRWARPVGG